MTDRFAACMAVIWPYEGAFVNDPKDPGGATNLGITLATARHNGLDVDGDGDIDITDIKHLTHELAAPVYRSQYWNAAGCDRLPAGVDLIVFDSAINCAPARAVRWLQIAAGVAADGKIGPVTLGRIAAASPRILVDSIVAQRRVHYRDQPTFDRFGKGWLARLADVRSRAIQAAGTLPQSLVQGT